MIPLWLTDKLRNPPMAGAGVHAWLYQCARQMHAHMQPGEIVARLTASVASCGRKVTQREIADAVLNSAETAWRLGDEGSEQRSTSTPAIAREARPQWPEFSHYARERVLAEIEGECTSLADLWERSPARTEDWSAEDFIDALYPGDPWLCCAHRRPEQSATKRRSQWEFQLDDMSFIVASPMTKALGVTREGKPSPRSIKNTGPRRYLIVEFDDRAGQDEHAALLWYLDRASAIVGGPRMCLAVHSGGKSLHGWFVVDRDETLLRDWFSFAVRIGADTAPFTICQPIRMPEGRRDNGSRQTVFYFAPCHLPTSLPGSLSGSPPQRHQQGRSVSALDVVAT